MKNNIILFTSTLVLMTTGADAQIPLKEYKAGHIFYIGLPDYMIRTIGLNDAATIQYKNVVKDVYGFVIDDNKDEMSLADLAFSSIDEFYEAFINDFLKDETQRKISKPVASSKGDVKFIECDASYYDQEAQIDIYYLIGIVETKDSFYKVLSFCSLDNKSKFKEDFRKILYSLRD